MKSKEIFTLAIALAFMTGCASSTLKHVGEKMPSTNTSLLKVSGETISELSDPYNLMIQINFESEDGNWTRIDNTDFNITDSRGNSRDYNIIVGKDLQTWAVAKAEQIKIKEHNSGLGQLGVLALSYSALMVGTASQSKAITGAGAVGLVGVAVYSTADSFQKMKGLAQGVANVPETHLLAPFTIPSQLLVKRWVLINFPKGYSDEVITLKMKTVEGETLNYKVLLPYKK